VTYAHPVGWLLGNVVSLYFGGVAGAVGPDGRPGTMPAKRWLASDYLAAALPLGLRVRACVEPRWSGGPNSGGPLAEQWCPEAASASYTGLPAAVVWHFQRG